MKTRTITTEQWNAAASRDRRIRFRGADGPGEYTWNENDSRFEPVTQPIATAAAYDFDSGFGIGGINRYQPTAAEEMAQIEAEIRHAEREEKRVRRGMRGQLWEPCWCGTEPVCLDCFKCHKHCDC